MSISLLITGGTIDKHYNPLNGELIFVDSHIPALLAQGRCELDLTIETVLAKDSLEMDDADRQLVLAACQASDASRIIITHGTDTMVETAEVLQAGLRGKTVVLVGAMVPFAFKQSDALFNVGCAIGAVQCLDEGVFIAMNGQIFPWDKVVKNRAEGRFQAV